MGKVGEVRVVYSARAVNVGYNKRSIDARSTEVHAMITISSSVEPGGNYQSYRFTLSTFKASHRTKNMLPIRLESADS